MSDKGVRESEQMSNVVMCIVREPLWLQWGTDCGIKNSARRASQADGDVG